MTMLDPHLDIDQLSAAVDGLTDEATSAHLATCLACQEQVEVWRRTLGQLKDLATVDAPAPDDAIATALAEWTPPSAAPAPATPVTSISTARATRRRWRPSAQLISAVAAVVVVFGIGIALVHSGGGGSSKSSGAATSSVGSPTAGTSGTSSSSTGAASGGSSSSNGSAGTVRGATTHATGTPISTSRRAVLSADLKRYTATNAKRPVAASTPCLKDAKAAAVRDAVAAAGGPVAPSYLVPVTYKGVQSQAFVFTRSVGYVAFVLKDDTCGLVTRLNF